MGLLLSFFLMAAVQTTPIPEIELPLVAEGPIVEEARIYDIPLSEELQTYTFELCQEKNVDYEMVLALMKVESDYNASLVSQTNDYGIMQINRVNHKWLREQLGITDFLDPRQNILCGVTMLGNLRAKYEENHKILMAYNMGEGGARTKWLQNVYTSHYSRKVMAVREELVERKKD